MNLGLWGSISPKTILGAIARGGGGPSDTTGPAVAITSASADIVAAAFSVTITFTNPETSEVEEVTGFALGDITVGNGTAGTFANPSTGVYTAVITPTATGTVTVDVGAGVCTDAAGNNNTAATQFSILYVAAQVWVDFSDISTLFQDEAGTTPVTADGQSIQRVNDKSGSGNNMTEATNPPTYKAAIQASKSIARFDAINDILTSPALASFPSKRGTLFVVSNKTKAGYGGCIGNASGIAWRFYQPGTGLAFYGWNDNASVKHLEDIATDNGWRVFTMNRTGNTTLNFRKNGSAIGDVTIADNQPAATAITLSGVETLGGDVAEVLLFTTSLSAGAAAAIESYLNTKWSVF